MTISILSSIFGKSSTRFTNESNGLPCWTDAKTVTVDIMTSSDNSDAPLSTEQVNESAVATGILAADTKTAKILKPTQLRIVILTSNASLVENILALFADVTATLSVTSKSVVASAMCIAGVEIDQNPDMLSATKVTIVMEQAQVSNVSSFNPAQSADQSTYGVSVASPASVGPSLNGITAGAGSLVASAGDAVTSLYSRISSNIGI